MPAELLRHKLAAVADAEDGNAQREYRRIDTGRVRGIDTVRPAGKDDACRVEGADFLHSGGIGLQLAVDVLLPHTAGNELIILAAKVQNQDFF